MAEPARPLVPEDYEDEETSTPQETQEPVVEETDPEDEPSERDLVDQPEPNVYDARRIFERRNEQEATQTAPPEPPPKEPQENPELEQKREERTKDIAEKVKDSRQRFRKATNKTVGKEAGSAAGKEAGERAAAQGAKASAKAASKAASQMAKAAAKATAQAGRVAVRFLFGTPVGWAIIGSILLIILILAIMFMVYSMSGDGGKGPAQYPQTAEDFAQVTSLMAVSNDVNATRKTILTSINQTETRLAGLKREAAKKYNATKAQAAAAEIDAIIKEINLLKPVAADPVQRKVIIDRINAAVESFAQKYPELLFSVGKCADLQPYIDDKKFIITRAPEREMIAQGLLMRGGYQGIARQEIKVNPKLCNLILFIVTNGYDIGGSTLTYGHRRYSSGTSTSQHYVGEAIDISVINGAAVSSSKGKSQANTLMQLLRRNYQQLGIWELWGPSAFSVDNCRTTSKRISGHDNHIHLGTTNPSTELQCH